MRYIVHRFHLPKGLPRPPVGPEWASFLLLAQGCYPRVIPHRSLPCFPVLDPAFFLFKIFLLLDVFWGRFQKSILRSVAWEIICFETLYRWKYLFSPDIWLAFWLVKLLSPLHTLQSTSVFHWSWAAFLSRAGKSFPPWSKGLGTQLFAKTLSIRCSALSSSFTLLPRLPHPANSKPLGCFLSVT